MNHRTRIVASTIAIFAAASVAFGAGGPGRQQDGKSARTEVRVRIIERFDANRDGSLSADERAAAKEARAARRAEIRTKIKATLVERFDTNDDGKLDEAERAAARAQVKAKREAAGKDGRHGKHRKFLRAALIRRALRA